MDQNSGNLIGLETAHAQRRAKTRKDSDSVEAWGVAGAWSGLRSGWPSLRWRPNYVRTYLDSPYGVYRLGEMMQHSVVVRVMHFRASFAGTFLFAAIMTRNEQISKVMISRSGDRPIAPRSCEWDDDMASTQPIMCRHTETGAAWRRAYCERNGTSLAVQSPVAADRSTRAGYGLARRIKVNKADPFPSLQIDTTSRRVGILGQTAPRCLHCLHQLALLPSVKQPKSYPCAVKIRAKWHKAT